MHEMVPQGSEMYVFPVVYIWTFNTSKDCLLMQRKSEHMVHLTIFPVLQYNSSCKIESLSIHSSAFHFPFRGWAGHAQVQKNIKQLFLNMWRLDKFQCLRIHFKGVRVLNIEFPICKTTRGNIDILFNFSIFIWS